MSTSAKLNIYDEDGHQYAIDRTYDGMPLAAGADILRALYREPTRGDRGPRPTFGEGKRNPAGYITSRLVRAQEDHTLCPLDQWRGFEFLYEIHAHTGAVILHERDRAETWSSGPNTDGGTVYTPTPDQEGAHQLTEKVRGDRERANGRTWVRNMTIGDGDGLPLLPDIDEHGRDDMDTAATPIVTDTVTTWIDLDSGDLVGRSLVAKTPRISINGHDEPNDTELAARNGTRAQIFWHEQKAVTHEGETVRLSEAQMQELAKAYRKQRRKVAA